VSQRGLSLPGIRLYRSSKSSERLGVRRVKSKFFGTVSARQVGWEYQMVGDCTGLPRCRLRGGTRLPTLLPNALLTDRRRTSIPTPTSSNAENR
jgi:hypothetical protein